MAVCGGNFGRLMQVKMKLKEIDTLLYEIARDFRVSGLPLDNKHVRESCKIAFKLIDSIHKKVHEVFDEACKSPVTGDHDGVGAVKE
jgi:hypothetical protein